MTDLADGLERIAGEAWDATTTRRQSELVNLSFTLRDARLVKYVYEGEERQAYVGTVAIDGAEEEVFLRGAICTKQINWLVTNAMLPAPLKLVRDSERFGSPYVLKADEPARTKGTGDANGQSASAAAGEDAVRAA